MVLDLLTVAVMGLIGSRLVVAARRAVLTPATRQHVVDIVRGLRPRHFLMAPAALALVVLAADALIAVPGLDFGWWTAIGGIGNPVIGATDHTRGTPLEWLIPLVFIVLLVPGLPLFAEAEEVAFRKGAEDWSTWRRLRRGVEFGLVHAIVGIPIGVALALSIGGWYFTWRYLRGGLPESTRAHLAYNLEVLVIVALVLAGVLT